MFWSTARDAGREHTKLPGDDARWIDMKVGDDLYLSGVLGKEAPSHSFGLSLAMIALLSYGS